MRKDDISTTIMTNMKLTDSQTQAALIESCSASLAGTLARNRGKNSDRIAVKATTPKYLSGCCPLITCQNPEKGLEGGLRWTAFSMDLFR